MKKTTQTVLIILAVGVGGALIYYLIKKSQETTAPTTTPTTEDEFSWAQLGSLLDSFISSGSSLAEYLNSILGNTESG